MRLLRQLWLRGQNDNFLNDVAIKVSAGHGTVLLKAGRLESLDIYLEYNLLLYHVGTVEVSLVVFRTYIPKLRKEPACW